MSGSIRSQREFLSNAAHLITARNNSNRVSRAFMFTLNNERNHRVHLHYAETIKVRGRERSKVAAGDPFAFSFSSSAADTLGNIFLVGATGNKKRGFSLGRIDRYR